VAVAIKVPYGDGAAPDTTDVVRPEPDTTNVVQQPIPVQVTEEPEFNPYADMVKEDFGAPAADANPYQSMVNEDFGGAVPALQRSLMVAADKNPARQARVLQLSKEMGLPPDMVDRNFDAVEKGYKRTKLDFGQVMEQTPAVGRFLQDPNNAALAQDDLAPLEKLERGFKIYADSKKPRPEQSLMNLPGEMVNSGLVGTNNLVAGGNAVAILFGAHPDSEAGYQSIADANKRATELQSLYTPAHVEFNKQLAKEGEQFSAEFQSEGKRFQNESQMRLIGRAYEEFKKGRLIDALKGWYEGRYKVTGELFDVVRLAAANPRESLVTATESMAFSAPSIAGQMAGIPLGPAGMAAGSFLGSVGTETGAEVLDLMRKDGYDLSNVDDVRRAFSDPAKMAKWKEMALAKGVTISLASAAFDGLSGKLYTAIKAESKALARKGAAVAGSTLVGMATESAGEGLGQLAEAKGDVSQINPAEIVQEGLFSPGQSVISTAIGATVDKAKETIAPPPPEDPGIRNSLPENPADAVVELVNRHDEADRVEHDIQALREAGLAITELKNVNQVPGKVQELLDIAGDGQPNSIFFQADDFDAYWKGKGLDPMQAATQMTGDPQAYHEAKANGTPIEVPLGKYLEQVAPTEHFEGLLNITRSSADGMTLAEAKEVKDQLEPTMNALANEAMTTKEVKPDNSEAVSEIKKDFTNQVMATGAYPKSVVAPIAELQSQRQATRADILEEDVTELYRGTPKVQAVEDVPGEAITEPEPHVLQQMDGEDAANVIDAASRFKKEKQSIKDQFMEWASNKYGDDWLDFTDEQTKAIEAEFRKEKKIPEPPPPIYSIRKNEGGLGWDILQDGERHENPRLSNFKTKKAAQTMLTSIVEEAARSPEEKALRSFKARFGEEKEVQAAIDKAQNPKKGPYVTDSAIPGIGWAPNFAAEPTGVIGPAKITHTAQADPLKWADVKYGVTLNLIKKHAEQGIPLVINTSSDLVAADNYIAAMPKGTVVNMYLLPAEQGTNFSDNTSRIIFPANASRQRQMNAAKHLKNAGITVNLIEPSIEDVMKAAGGTKVVAKKLGVKPAEALAELTKRLTPRLTAIQGGKADVLFQRAFHGSPHKFERFSLQKIGTGEGQQAYGWGLYFSKSKEVAEYYRKTLTAGAQLNALSAEENNVLPNWVRNAIASHGKYGPEYGAARLDSDILDFQNRLDENESDRAASAQPWLVDERVNGLKKILSVLNKVKASGDFSSHEGGHIYQAEIPEDSDLIYWDKPISEQPDKVKAAIEAASPESPIGRVLKEMLPQYKIENREMTGAQFYLHLREDKYAGGEQAASHLLSQSGIQGIKYLDGASRDGSGDAHNYVIFDDRLIEIHPPESEYLQQKEQSQVIRGYFDRMSKIIGLLPKANESTLIHELSHSWFQEMREDVAKLMAKDPAKLTAKQSQLLEDGQALLDWLGADSWESVTRDQQEKFAEAWEAYAAEGKAPSTKLQRAFRAFAVWMTRLGRTLLGLNVEMSQEVRDIFARMVATEDQIAAAEAQTPNLTAEHMGLTGEKADAYNKALAEAGAMASERLLSKLMARARKSQAVAYKQQRAAIRGEIEAQVNQRAEYRAIHFLQKGTMPDGSALPGVTPFKLSRQSIITQSNFGPARLKTLPRGVVAKDGIHFNVAAEMLGFRNGEELLTAMEVAEDKNSLIDRLTDERMNEEYPDLLTDPKLPEETVRALHNEKRAQLLRMQLEYIAENHMPVLKDAIRKVGARVPSEKLVREQAARTVGRRSVEELKPYLYQRAEIKAAREAGVALARGDFEAAFEAKRRELLNHELFRAATEAKERMEKGFEFFKKLSKSDEKLAKSRDTDLVNAARAILTQFGIGKTDKPWTAYLEKTQEYDPDTYATVKAIVEMATAEVKPYRQMSFDDFTALHDTVQAIWDLAKSTREIDIRGEKMDIEEVRARLDTHLVEMQKPGNSDGYTREMTKWEKAKLGFLGIRAALRRVEAWVEAMDGGNPDGDFRKAIFEPVSEAASRYREAKKAQLEKLLAILQPLAKTLGGPEIVAPELGNQGTFGPGTQGLHVFANRAELLGAILHTGNESNLSKLLRGNGWGTVSEDGVLDTSKWDAFIRRMWKEGVLTKTDYDVIQQLWDMFEETKPQAQRAHKQMYGYYFDEISRKEIVTPFGTYEGGYVPAKADPFKSEDAAIRGEQAASEQGGNSYQYPTAGRGFTKSRVDAYAAPLVMDLRLISMALDSHLRFIHLEPAVKQVARIVFDKGFRKSLGAVDPAVASDMLVPWLQRSATQRVQVSSQGRGGKAFDGFLRELRRRTGMQVMVGSVVNAVEQVFGLSLAAVRVKPALLRNALFEYIKSPSKAAEVASDKSVFMRTKLNASSIEIQGHIEALILDPTKYEQAKEFANKHGYFMQGAAQNIVDVVTWNAGYEQAIGNGATESEAVLAADADVRQTQGSASAEDISRFETGTAFTRMFTMFYSYFNMQANMLGTEFAKVARGVGVKKGTGRLLYVYAMGFALPAILGATLRKGASGGLDEDDDDEYMDDVMDVIFGSQFRSATAMVPGAGQVITSGINALNNKYYDDRISASPAISVLEATGRVAFGKTAEDLFGSNGNAKAGARDLLTILGIASGLPLGPLAKPIGYGIDVSKGKARPTGPIDFTRGLVTGRK